MKIKDNFWCGVILSVVIFFVLYTIITIFAPFSYFSLTRDSSWVYIVSLIPNLLLSRFMLVKWDLESIGRGMFFTTLIGIIIVMYIVLR